MDGSGSIARSESLTLVPPGGEASLAEGQSSILPSPPPSGLGLGTVGVRLPPPLLGGGGRLGDASQEALLPPPPSGLGLGDMREPSHTVGERGYVGHLRTCRPHGRLRGRGLRRAPAIPLSRAGRRWRSETPGCACVRTCIYGAVSQQARACAAREEGGRCAGARCAALLARCVACTWRRWLCVCVLGRAGVNVLAVAIVSVRSSVWQRAECCVAHCAMWCNVVLLWVVQCQLCMCAGQTVVSRFVHRACSLA